MTSGGAQTVLGRSQCVSVKEPRLIFLLRDTSGSWKPSLITSEAHTLAIIAITVRNLGTRRQSTRHTAFVTRADGLHNSSGRSE